MSLKTALICIAVAVMAVLINLIWRAIDILRSIRPRRLDGYRVGQVRK